MSSFLLLNPRVMSFIMALSKVWMANDSHRVWFLGVLLQKYNTMLLTQWLVSTLKYIFTELCFKKG